MKTVLVTDVLEPEMLWARRCRRRDRLRARLRAPALDRALAAGASPDSGVLLSLRAEALLSLANRRALARTLRRLVRDATRPMQPLGPVLPLARREIIRHRALIHELAAVLDESGPVDLRGVAAAEMLLRDGAGPLYVADPRHSLEPRLHTVLTALCSPPAGSAVV